eukprot:s3901_g6.t1
MDVLDGLEGEQGMDFHSILLATEVLEPYVLSWTLGEVVDGDAECTVLALMRREDGVLLVLPDGFLPESIVERGNAGEEGVIFGPSRAFDVPAMIVDGGVPSRTGSTVKVLVVDCLPGVSAHLRRFAADEEIVYGYDEESPFAFPVIDALVLAVREWLAEVPDLGAFYTPEELEEQKADTPPPTPAQRRKGPQRKGTPLGDGAKPKRPTTTSLAAELQMLVETLPKFSEQISQLTERQKLVEERLMPTVAPVGPDRQTLAAAMSPQPGRPLGSLAKSLGAPPRTTSRMNPGTLASVLDHQPADVAALEAEKPGAAAMSSLTADGTLAQAIYEQSKALNLLMSQIAHGQADPMVELSGTSTPGTTRATGRARLQAELAAHKGSFFVSVLQSMARRMSPTSSVDLAPSVLMDKGISGLRYLERFGGYSRQRELGLLQFQVMTAFDFLMVNNIPAAKDTIALLAVTIEQSCLNNGRMDLATLLCLQEDPPAAIFQNRQLSATSRARSFAPLADQRWITTALAFLKELEVINAKRNELAPGLRANKDGLSGPSAKPKAKANPKRKGKGKGAAVQEEGEAQ